MRTARYATAVVLLITAPFAIADINILLEPTEIPDNTETDVAIILMSNPGLHTYVSYIAFDFDVTSEAWEALNPIDFSWTPEIMHDPSQFFITEELPHPQALGFIGFGPGVPVPDGVPVEFARITFSPSDALGTWSMPANAVIADENAGPLQVKTGDPFVITIVPEPATAYLLAGTAFMLRRRRRGSRRHSRRPALRLRNLRKMMRGFCRCGTWGSGDIRSRRLEACESMPQSENAKRV